MNLINALNASEDYNPQEIELMKERADALGRSGEQLQQAIAQFTATQCPRQRADFCHRAALKLQALIIQRELLGFVHDNEVWIRKSFTIPNQIWERYLRL